MTQFLTLLPLCIVGVGIIALIIIWAQDEMARHSRTPEPITDEQIHAIQREPWVGIDDFAATVDRDWNWPAKATDRATACRKCGSPGPYPQHPGICWSCLLTENENRRMDK